MKRITISIPTDLLDELSRVAKVRGRSKSIIITDAVQMYLAGARTVHISDVLQAEIDKTPYDTDGLIQHALVEYFKGDDK